MGLEVGDTVDLRCVSRQLFPNGSAIYETMARTSVTVVSSKFKTKIFVSVINHNAWLLLDFDAKAAARNGEEVGEAGSTTAGMVIAILITLFVLFALIFICYAQKAKVRTAQHVLCISDCLINNITPSFAEVLLCPRRLPEDSSRR